MDEIVLQMSHISKIYGNGIVANGDVCFDLRRGEVHALVGENGAGKTTLMKILFGMEKPSSGTITLNGKPIEMNSSEDAIKHGIGMVHQHFMLVSSFTVAQNIALGMEPKRGLFVDSAKVSEFSRKLSEQYNLHIEPDVPVGTLPVGQKQKVEILKALARGAKILILDEPTAVLTPQETDQLFDELKNLKQQGHTIIFISHKIREVKAISDRVTVMRDGKSVGVFNTADVSEQEISAKIVGWSMGGELEKSPPKQGEIAISVSNVTCCGDSSVPVVNDVSFCVRGGTVLGIAGVQGNGQVELIEMITRARPLEKGEIKIKGKDISSLSVRGLRELGEAYIPEDRLRQGVAKNSSIGENLISTRYHKPPLSLRGMLNRKRIADFAKDSIAKYEIKCFGQGQKISMLSGGNMQKVVAARECGDDVSALIAEQPTRGVDIGAARIIHKRILDMREKGCAILLVSADLSEVMQLSDRLAVMYDGKIVGYFDDMTSVTEEELGLCMLGLHKHSPERIAEVAL